MDLTKFWVIVVFVVFYEQSTVANNVNVPNDKDRPGRSRQKKSADTEIFLAFPPDNNYSKTGKQDGPPTLIRLDANAPNRFKGKFPTPIERFIQRIQNYFSVYNPPEYLNDLRPGINNPDNYEEPVDHSNNTQIILPCNGTSTIVIIPVPLENENVYTDQITNSNKPEPYYNIPSTPIVSYPSDITIPPCSDTTSNANCLNTATPKPPCAEETTTTTTTAKPICPEATTPQPTPCADETTTPKPKCPEVTTPKPNCPEVTTPKHICPETTTPKPKCPEVTTPKPKCPEVTTPKPKCPELTTPKSNCPESTTPKPNCPEVTTPKPKCPEVTTPKPEYPEVATQKPYYYPPKHHSTTSHHFKPISGYGSSETPPLHIIAQPVLRSTMVYYYNNPSTSPPHPASFYIPSGSTLYQEHSTRQPKPPILRLKQMLFPRLYAAFHPDEN